MALLLLQTKLFPPSVRPSLVFRPHLHARLNDGLFDANHHFTRRLTLVAAPAGFGKTTLIASWLDDLPSQLPSAWLSLDEEDNDLARFLTYLLAALEAIDPQLTQSAAPLLSSPQPPRAEAILTLLINDIVQLSSAFILVLDDYHVITTQPIQQALAFLLDHMPPQMHLVLMTRVEPPLPLTRLRGRGQLNDFREADLRFNVEEADAFLKQIAGQELSSEEVSLLTRRTEGWITGLQMIALSMRGRVNLAAFIDDLTGSHAYIADYLTQEVLDQQPKELRRFLLQTSILRRFCGPLCEAVTGQSDGQWMLEALAEANLFLIGLDDDRCWFRYHHLFADLLRRRLQQDHGSEMAGLHQRASVWFEANGYTDDAIHHAKKAQDYDRVADLIETVAESTLMRSGTTTFLNWLEGLPEAIINSRPLLCIYQAVSMLWSQVPFEEVLARLDDAVRADDTGIFAGEVLAFKAIIAAYRGQLQESAEFAKGALDLLPEDRMFFRSTCVSGAGIAYLWQGDLTNAAHFFDEAVRLADQNKNRLTQVLARSHQGEVYVIQGRLRQAIERFDEALTFATITKGQRLPVAGTALTNIARVLYEWNELEQAETFILEGMELVQSWAPAATMGGHATLALIRQVQGDEASAQKSMEKAMQSARQFDAMSVDDDYYAALQARLWLLQGDWIAARRWAEERGLSPKTNWSSPAGQETGEAESMIRTLEYLTATQIWLAQSPADETNIWATLELLERVRQRAEEAGWGSVLVRAHLQMAIAHQALGEEERAMALLIQALTFSEPEGYVRIYLDEGQPMLELLYKAATRGTGTNYVGQLLSAFDWQVSNSESEFFVEQDGDLIEPLSDREVEVLQLIAEGLTNREIALDLVLSPNTVKVHTYNIYGKLGVHTRTQAVAKAKVLGILDGR